MSRTLSDEIASLMACVAPKDFKDVIIIIMIITFLKSLGATQVIRLNTSSIDLYSMPPI
jgi:hypothetical protein